MRMSEYGKRIAAAGIKRPINWFEMGSSEKDLWEDRQIAWLDRLAKKAEEKS